MTERRAERERLFFLLKPDGVPREEEILSFLRPVAEVIARRTFGRAPLKRFALLYAEHRERPFYPWLMAIFRSRPVTAFILAARDPGAADFHGRVAEIVGHTDPRQAAPGTIRALSPDDMTVSMREGRAVRNLCHRSRTIAESLREGGIFFHDRRAPDERGIRPGLLAARLVSPWTNAGAETSGIFLGERLAKGLAQLGVIPSEARLESCEERSIFPDSSSGGLPVAVVEARWRMPHQASRVSTAMLSALPDGRVAANHVRTFPTL